MSARVNGPFNCPYPALMNIEQNQSEPAFSTLTTRHFRGKPPLAVYFKLDALILL